MSGKLLLRRLTIAFGLIAAVISILAIFTAHFGIILVSSLNQNYRTMALSAALIWIFIGSVLAYQAVQPLRRISLRVVQAFLVLIAAVEAIEFVFSVQGSHSFIETLSVRAGTVVLGPTSLPVSPVAAGFIVLAAIALVFVLRDKGLPAQSMRTADAISIAGLAISVISFTFVMSYFYRNPLLYGTQFIPIAFLSALASFFAGAALVAAAGPGAVPVRYIIGNSTSAGLFRVFVSLVVGIILIENIVLVGLSSWFDVHEAILLSTTLVIFILATALVVARVSGAMGMKLERAEQELVRKNEDLGAMNEELTAIEEELRQANDGLLANERQLLQKNEDLGAMNQELTAIQEELRRNLGELTLTQEILSASETRLRRFYESGLIGVIYWNMNGIITDANDKFLELVGYSREDLVAGRIDWVTMTPPEYRDLDEDSMRELKSTGVNKKPFEKEYIRKDGTRLPIIIAGATLDEVRFNGVAFVLDITERKRAEEKQQTTLKRFYHILSSMQYGILLVTNENRVEFANQRFCDIFGLEESPEDLSGLSDEEMIGKIRHSYEDPQRAAARIREIVRSGKLVYGEDVGMRNERVFLRDFVPLYIGGNIFGRLWIHRDITERRKAEAALRQNENQLKSDLEAMKLLQEIGMLYIHRGNLEPVLTEVVDAAIAITGADFGNLQLVDPVSSDLRIRAQHGFPDWWLDYWDTVRKGQGTCGTALSRGERVIVEDIKQSPIFAGTPALAIQLRAGVRAVLSTPLVSREGKPLGMFSTHFKVPHRPDERQLQLLDLLARQAADIIERAQAEEAFLKKNVELNEAYEAISSKEEELRQNLKELSLREHDLIKSEADLRDALAEKEILLSEIHHRVKNNLTAFISLLSLGGTYEESEAGRALKKDLQNRARSMALIHETLYQTGKFSNVDMEVYLTNLVSQIAGSYAERSKIRIVVDVHGVNLDIARATTAGLIINELLTNSFKYAFPLGFDCMAVRGEPCTIRVSLAHEDGTDVLTVVDNGRGLPGGFDPLATKSLGLKLVTFLARHQLQAEIGIRAERGTEFSFHLKDNGDEP